MDMKNYVYYQHVKSKRQRECNWDRNEKKALLRFVQRYRPIIDNKGNDNVWIRRKNAAWEAIQRAMAAEGFRRGVKSVRQQWTRMKGAARRKLMKIKKEVNPNTDTEQVDDDPPPIIPIANTGPDPLDCIVKTEECEPPEMGLSNEDSLIAPTDDDDDDGLMPFNDNLMSVDSILNSIPSPNCEQTDSSGIASTTTSTNGSATEHSLPPPIPTERKLLPKSPFGRNVLHARIRQIEEETVQKAEIHSLEVAHRKEIHALRVEQMRDQIEQQRWLFEAQLAKLKNSN